MKYFIRIENFLEQKWVASNKQNKCKIILKSIQVIDRQNMWQKEQNKWNPGTKWTMNNMKQHDFDASIRFIWFYSSTSSSSITFASFRSFSSFSKHSNLWTCLPLCSFEEDKCPHECLQMRIQRPRCL